MGNTPTTPTYTSHHQQQQQQQQQQQHYPSINTRQQRLSSENAYLERIIDQDEKASEVGEASGYQPPVLKATPDYAQYGLAVTERGMFQHICCVGMYRCVEERIVW
jgi:hypothetical protein